MIEVKIDTREVEMMLGDLRHKMPSVVARGLTKTAVDVQEKLRQELPAYIDRPTPYTLRSIIVSPAQKSREILQAVVGFASPGERTILGPDDGNKSHMIPQVYGGSRPMKDSEKTLTFLGANILPPGRQIVPGRGMPLDRYGNIKGGMMNRILYQGVKRGSASMGYASPLNKRGEAASRKGQYFVARVNGIAIGIFKNMGKGVKPLSMLIFGKAARYRPRFPFHSIANRIAEVRLPIRVQESIQMILAKYK